MARDRGARSARWRPTRWGLRRRVTVSFGLVALLLSLVMSAVTWSLVTPSLLREGRAAALAETAVDAGHLDTRLAGGSSLGQRVLADLPRTDATAAMARVGDRWYASAPTLGPDILPAAFVEAVGEQHVATQRVEVDGALYLAVGMPIAGRSTSFVELYDMTGTQGAVRALLVGLTAATAVTVLIGVAVGRYATQVALRPLSRLNTAAADVARGRLGVRLQHGGDPDLVPLTDSFNRTVTALDHRVVADARFATDVSHELRTPLTTMLNSMQVILNREASLPASLREPVALLADELTRFRVLVTDLLEIARYEAGDQLVRERVLVGDLVRRAADGTARRPVTTVAQDAADLVLPLDKRRLERVVANLVRNAETHGGGCAGVEVTRTATGARVTVDDDGPGVAPALRERVFDRFARGPGADSGGVGLGLAIVLRHVDLHGGTVLAQDRPEGGARFVVDLPADPTD
ncbi:sensor histidine kinase [Phycicoccus flavus]|uniref:sensor histidine kinase n=1 Tax=Phycicoccus flavus TaxID=2502783 RepID=UPI000FEC19B9|nr:HAMP domain-containing sensor histidine kinase [Phycicoccus flavus]NHA67273.1 HAMP domain-containing histidine kinase [Phycicoccus flavus]